MASNGDTGTVASTTSPQPSDPTCHSTMDVETSRAQDTNEQSSSQPEGSSREDTLITDDMIPSDEHSASASPGCGKDDRTNDRKVHVAGSGFPSTYDGETPMPTPFGFRGSGGGNRCDASRNEYTDLTRSNVLGEEYVVAVPISSDTGGCWNCDNDIGRVRDRFRQNFRATSAKSVARVNKVQVDANLTAHVVG